MSPVRVVIANPTQDLPPSLLLRFKRHPLSLATVDAPVGLWETVPRLRAQLAVVDLELISFAELNKLCREFPETAFVCIHRLADDFIWSQSLAAGAVDCCLPSDLPHILENAERYIALKHADAVSAA